MPAQSGSCRTPGPRLVPLTSTLLRPRSDRSPLGTLSAIH
ncbi:hypothetical protein Mal4_48330 [Maioricimonas rarisocia]|uniref:Uncharacterized protein n=1 Tax=Maioricimonas rarisocia TaxID=2528026 RepID=A0A517ZDB1_9PLAN|nr:hypothetical protein Mal4_48330 [Maioricimonas rarisocia]